MKFDEACVLLPCHSLEDFPTHYERAAAEGLLAAWSALWHPRLLAECGRLPTWYRAEGPPDALAGRLIIVPQSSEPLLLAGWAARAAQEGAHLVRKLVRRDEIVAAALAGLDGPATAIDPELAADFLALGYGYLAVELLTRQMRYMSNIDEVHLQNEAVAAARACLAGDGEAARRHLQNSFEVLIEARERFYPVDAYLVDFTLVAATTVGESLRRQLASDTPQNLLLTGETLAHLAATAPDTLAALRLAIDRASVTLVGGEYREREIPLLPIEETLDELREGENIFRELVGFAPRVFGRRRFGLSPLLPQILSRFGFLGAVHATLDDGRFPTSAQSKVRWEGLDHSAIDALVRLPLDASRPETFLGLPRALGESMDRDHVATVVFAHWPSQASTFYDDLRRMAAYGAVLGRFVTLDEYFTNTTSPGELVKFKADGYRSPYLRQALAAKESQPISGLAEEHARQSRRAAIDAVRVMADALGAPPTEHVPIDVPAESLEPLATEARRLSAALRGRDASDKGTLLVNPLSFARRSLVDVTDLGGLPTVDGPLVAAQESSGRKFAVADVPGMGFCWLTAGSAIPQSKKSPKPIAQGTTLVNEHMRVEISPEAGSIRAIYDLAQRGNRMASQVALRVPGPPPKPGDIWRDPDLSAEYSTMAADAIEITHAGSAFGEITSRGRLLLGASRQVARFVARYQLTHGGRVLGVETELELDEPPAGDPWESYYAARFAWPDEAADVYRNVGLARQPTEARHIEAPLYVELRTPRSRTAILTAGLPYHRRAGTRMLDTLLIVAGETRRRFRYAIGLDLPHPAQQALEQLNPVVVVPGTARPGGAHPSNWLFHVDAKNVIATHWSTMVSGDTSVGFRARLVETEGFSGRVRLRTLRDIENARQVDFRGETLAELPVAGDCVTIDVAAFEWVEIEVRLRA